MKNFRHLLTLILVSICAVHSAWADRSAPELPEAQTLVSGTSYYLYNVMEGKFLCRSTTSANNPAIGTYGDKVVITATSNDDEFTIQWASNNYYFYAENAGVSSRSNINSKTSMFTIAESAQGYTIQRSPSNTVYYKADEFVGYNGNNGDRLNPALAEGSIHWRLMSVEDAEYYFAKHKLYTYLEAADSYNFYVTQYDAVYNNGASTTAELDQAQSTLQNALEISVNYVSPSWTDYPILFQNNSNNHWESYSNNTGLRWEYKSKGIDDTSKLMGTVDVDEDVTLVFKCFTTNSYSNFRVYLDDELVQTISNNTCNGSSMERRYYVEMGAGKHDIKWECQFNGSSANIGNNYYSYITEIGIQKTPTMIPATTTVEGQLGTEVLKLTDNVANVRKIVVNGIIGADDWTTISMMVNAFDIDLSGATAEAPIPDNMFKGSKFPFLHSFKFPQGLTAIGNSAFYNSDIENEITFPASLISIGQLAFSETKIRAAHMPEGMTSVGSYAFQECYYLENATWPSTALTIPGGCFKSCSNLRTFTIPEGVTDIGSEAFRYCQQFNARFPNTLTTIREGAFYDSGIDELIVPEGLTLIENGAFSSCSNLISVTLPTSYYKITYGTSRSSFVARCKKLKDVYFKSPTVVYTNDIDFFNGCTAADLTIHVPSFLVSAYKLDPYWYNYNPTGFSTTEITDWTLRGDVKLNAGERLEGTPNVKIVGGATLTINGDDAMSLNNLVTNVNGTYTDKYRAEIISNTNNITVTGQYTYSYYTDEKKWYFLCLPFDVKVSNITSPDCSHAVRYYDGATRATNGNSGNWKNYAADDIIPAGTGFIYQTSTDCWSKFVAEDNATKNYVFSRNEFVKTLAANPSEVTADKGWNLVGNPWLSYYNIHKVNFTAPITVWDTNKKTYSAYSIIDDDYAIQPGQAFFVQCPDELNSISFPIDGRQLTSVIESQNGARQPGWSSENERRLMDIELSNGEQGDKTRLVVNPQAKMDYETTCDASKFLSLDASVPQIYTIQDGEQLAINERPAGNGVIQLGVILPSDGTYTIKSERNALTEAVLVDTENGTETNLAYNDYTFSAPAGVSDTRFELHLSASSVTGISDVRNTADKKTNEIYNLNGQRVGADKSGIYVVDGKKIVVK